jgi:hypothetical protein
MPEFYYSEYTVIRKWQTKSCLVLPIHIVYYLEIPLYKILWADFLPSLDVVHVDQVTFRQLVGSKAVASFYMVSWVMSMGYGSTGCRVFKWGVQNWKDFWLKINVP